MTTTIESSDTHTERAPLRLHLIPTLGAGPDDGVWWPQSRDFAVEAADLVDHFPQHFGQINRVVFSRADWDSVPHRLAVSRGLIKVGSYPTDEGHRLMLSMSDRRLIRLRVKAVDAAPEDAEHSPHTDQDAADTTDAGESGEWTDGGGSWWGSGEVAPSHRV